jgi:hypothetical protein
MTVRRVLRSIADGLVWLDCAVVGCALCLKQDCLHGLAAYALAWHSLPPDRNGLGPSGESTEDQITPPDQRVDIVMMGQPSRQSAQRRDTAVISLADLGRPVQPNLKTDSKTARLKCTTRS